MFDQNPNFNSADRNEDFSGADKSILSFFQASEKEELLRMAEDVSKEAKDFFDISVSGLLGSLPDEVVDTQITTSKASLNQLLFSSMVTGYLAKTVEDRLSLEKLWNSGNTSSHDKKRNLVQEKLKASKRVAQRKSVLKEINAHLSEINEEEN